MKWLDPDTHTKRYIDTLEKWYPDTVQRPLKSEEYLNWANHDTQTLWCHGIAGGGKTVFASVVIDTLKNAQEDLSPQEKAGVACLFCEYERRNEQTIRSLTSALVRQLSDQCEILPLSVLDLYEKHQDNDRPLRLDEIVLVFADVLAKFSRVYLIVDALDECLESTRKELLSHLSELQRKTGMKILTTSRPTLNFLKEFGDCDQLDIKAEPEDVQQVLQMLIDKADTFLTSNVELRNKVAEVIASAVGGMYANNLIFLPTMV